MEISLWKKPEKKNKKNPGDYQVKMKQKSYFRTEDTNSKNSDKKKKSSEAQIVEPWYNENFATDGTWGGEGSLQTHQTNKQASMVRQAMQKPN